MLGRLPELNERWQAILKEPMNLGIGINTGMRRWATWARRQIQVRPAGQHRQPGQPGAGGDQAPEMPAAHHRRDPAKVDEGFATRRLCQCDW